MKLHSLLDIAERELEVVYELNLATNVDLRSVYKVELRGQDTEGTECEWVGVGFTPGTAAESVYDQMVFWIDRE